MLSGHLLTENRNALVVNTRVTLAVGKAERDAAIDMAKHIAGGSAPVTLAADRGYDTRGFLASLREMAVTPHVAQNRGGRSSAIDERTTRHSGYEFSQRRRKRVEEVFGWMKTVARMRKTRFRGPDRVGGMFTLAAQPTIRSACGISRRIAPERRAVVLEPTLADADGPSRAARGRPDLHLLTPRLVSARRPGSQVHPRSHPSTLASDRPAFCIAACSPRSPVRPTAR